MQTPRRATRSVWFFVVPGVELLDVCGPWEVLAQVNHVLGRPTYALELVGPEGPSVQTRHGLAIGGVRPLPRRRLPDIAIVAGGTPIAPAPVAEMRVAGWLRRHHARVPTLISICTGAFVLGEAGLLDGRRATTHWRHIGRLRARFPAAHVVDEGIFVRDSRSGGREAARRLWTSAGVTAGIDLTLALVEEDHGHDVAMTVAKELVLFLRRSGNQAQFSVALERQQKLPDEHHDLTAFVIEHIDEPLPVERLARALGKSPRSLSRWCRAQLGESPAELVRRLRVEQARGLLASSSLPLKDIAARTGLGDASTLWRAFVQRLGVTPAAYRERFAATGQRAKQ